jgi:hypothetical protein
MPVYNPSAGGGTPATTVTDETTYGIAPAVGTGTNYARQDHTHGSQATPTKTTVGLANVDNTSDAGKPVSTAQQTALDLKANIASPTLTGTPAAPTATPADNSTKIATTAYVDNAVLGQNFKEAVGAATTANLVGVYLNGASGVGATFTYTATGVDVIDGVTLTTNMRVLVKNQSTDFQNGIYTVSTAGALGVAGILTRALDADQTNEWKTGDSVFATAGTTQSTTTWAYTGIDSPTMGSTSITFAQTAGQGSFSSGNGITITGNSIAINTAVTVDLSTAQNLTNKNLNSGTNTFPTLNQNTTGSAAKWTTARNLAGNSVDGSADAAFANKFVVQGTADSGLSAAQFLGALSTGVVKNTTTTGALSIAVNTDLPVGTATQSGAMPTPPNDTTKFLRGDATWTTVTATPPTLNIDNLTASVNQTVTAGYGTVVPRSYLINSGIKLTIGSAGRFRVL